MNRTILRRQILTQQVERRIPRIKLYYDDQDWQLHDSARGIKVLSSAAAAELMRPLFEHLTAIEQAWMLLLGRSGQVKGTFLLCSGTTSSCLIDPIMVFGVATTALASTIILAHNHPSGQTRPSDIDLEITRRIAECGRMHRIDLYDHLVITNDSYFSFADNGMLSP